MPWVHPILSTCLQGGRCGGGSMKLLLDTHILLWAAQNSPRLSQQARDLINDPAHTLLFSVVSLWEIIIKNNLQRVDFVVNAAVLRNALLENGYEELPVAGEHVLALASLPLLHKDPFDRLLITQAIREGAHLLSVDAQVMQYQQYGAATIN